MLLKVFTNFYFVFVFLKGGIKVTLILKIQNLIVSRIISFLKVLFTKLILVSF
jgi:hypothetical protein